MYLSLEPRKLNYWPRLHGIVIHPWHATDIMSSHATKARALALPSKIGHMLYTTLEMRACGAGFNFHHVIKVGNFWISDCVGLNLLDAKSCSNNTSTFSPYTIQIYATTTQSYTQWNLRFTQVQVSRSLTVLPEPIKATQLVWHNTKPGRGASACKAYKLLRRLNYASEDLTLFS